MLKIDRKDFVIDQTSDGYRVKRIDIDGNNHTHLQSLSACNSVISSVMQRKIPRNTSIYILKSLIRLSNDESYINKVQELIDVRMQKGRKQMYFNPIKKK